MRPDALGRFGAMRRMTPLAGALQPAGDASPIPGPLPGRLQGRLPEPLSDRTRRAIAEYFAGRRGGSRSALLFAGPAVLASTAYMDPGNFAVNIEAGATYGYALLWVVLAANVVAMLFQALSAKLGVATGQNLAQLCRLHYPAPLCWAMWVGSEVAAMATDLAEFLGAAIGLALLFNIPLLAGMAVTFLLACAILALDRWGFRPAEILLAGLVAVIGGCYVIELAIVPVDWPAALAGSVVPTLPDTTAVALAAGIVGATVMPHALFLHSGLTQHRVEARSDRERRLLTRFSNREVVSALAVAGAVNLAIVLLAASVFGMNGQGIMNGQGATIASVYEALGLSLGSAAAIFFVVSLIISGLCSSAVGTMAGQIVMEGFVRFRVPVWVRRLVTILPAFVVIGIGTDPARALVLSQIVLSIALPIPMIPLVLFTMRRDVMGSLANRPLTNAAAITGAVLVLGLDLVLLVQTAGA
jgi:manganese transport protein